MIVRRFFGLTLVALIVSTTASAENAPDRTGTGGGPNSTITTPYTTSTGTTKPPGVEEAPATPAERRASKRIEREDDRIENGICAGCGK